MWTDIYCFENEKEEDFKKINCLFLKENVGVSLILNTNGYNDTLMEHLFPLIHEPTHSQRSFLCYFLLESTRTAGFGIYEIFLYVTRYPPSL
jgi:hypothetical protein